jgi:hypothetical protein
MRGLLVRGDLVEPQDELGQGGSQHRRSVKVAIEDESYEKESTVVPTKDVREHAPLIAGFAAALTASNFAAAPLVKAVSVAYVPSCKTFGAPPLTFASSSFSSSSPPPAASNNR